MKAMFSTVKEFAVFNAKPHLFQYSAPYQIGASDDNSPVWVDLVSGQQAKFTARVEQFGGVIIPETAH